MAMPGPASTDVTGALGPEALDAPETSSRRNRRPACLLAAVVAVSCASAAFLFHWQGVDVPAQLYRIGLFRHYGFVLWDSQWYSGQPVAGYSALFPATAAIVGLYATVAGAAGVAAWSFAALLSDRFGHRARLASVVFAAGLLVPVAIGQFPFLCGLAAGLVALVLAQRRRVVWAASFAVMCSLLSPVAGVFLIIALTGWAISARSSDKKFLAPLALVSALPLVVLGIAFPDSGTFPFWGEDFVVTLAVCILGLLVVPRALRGIRTGLVLYALAASVLFVIPNPVGGNFGRLCGLFSAPLVLVLSTMKGRLRLGLLAIPLLVWQWSPAMAAVASTRSEPSNSRGYFAPLLEYLETQPQTGRVEIPFTAGHWEAAFVAPTVPLARGWERQLDSADNPLFYGNRSLTAKRYRAWLDSNGVQWIALPDAPLDYSAQAESRLLRHPPRYLQPVWRNSHWQVWRVLGSRGILRGPGTLVSLRPDHVDIEARASGTFDLRVRYTSMWSVVAGKACVVAGANGWTRVEAEAPGQIVLGTSIIDPSSRCEP
jgi:hypothetical protein